MPNKARAAKTRKIFSESEVFLRDSSATRSHVLSLRAFRAIIKVKLDVLTFFESFVSVALNRGVVDENICAVSINETKSLGVIKPFHFADGHVYASLPVSAHEFPL